MRSARCPLFGRYQRKSGRRGHRVFVDAEVIRGGPLLEVAWRARERNLARRPASAPLRGPFFPAPIRGRCYCVRYLYATIRATMLAKISSAERDFRIIGFVEWRAADGAGRGLGRLWKRTTLPSVVGVRAFGSSGAAPTPPISL